MSSFLIFNEQGLKVKGKTKGCNRKKKEILSCACSDTHGLAYRFHSLYSPSLTAISHLVFTFDSYSSMDDSFDV